MIWQLCSYVTEIHIYVCQRQIQDCFCLLQYLWLPKNVNNLNAQQQKNKKELCDFFVYWKWNNYTEQCNFEEKKLNTKDYILFDSIHIKVKQTKPVCGVRNQNDGHRWVTGRGRNLSGSQNEPLECRNVQFWVLEMITQILYYIY